MPTEVQILTQSFIPKLHSDLGFNLLKVMGEIEIELKYANRCATNDKMNQLHWVSSRILSIRNNLIKFPSPYIPPHNVKMSRILST